IWFGYKLIKGTHFVRYSEMKFPQNDFVFEVVRWRKCQDNSAQKPGTCNICRWTFFASRAVATKVREAYLSDLLLATQQAQL
ncbi:hypothetical protein O5269_27915, partial [Escherichia coli]|nr:hypothetical protein [Escherichia coli]